MNKDMDWKTWALVIAGALVVVLISIISNKDHQILQLKIDSESYKKESEELRVREERALDSIASLDARYKLILKKYNKKPSDEEIVTNNPIDIITVNDNWSDIIKPFATAIDTSGGG